MTMILIFGFSRNNMLLALELYTDPVYKGDAVDTLSLSSRN